MRVSVEGEEAEGQRAKRDGEVFFRMNEFEIMTVLAFFFLTLFISLIFYINIGNCVVQGSPRGSACAIYPNTVLLVGLTLFLYKCAFGTVHVDRNILSNRYCPQPYCYILHLCMAKLSSNCDNTGQSLVGIWLLTIVSPRYDCTSYLIYVVSLA